MKKLLTILLVLISFSTFAQFEAGEYINSDTVKKNGVNLYLEHLKMNPQNNGKIARQQENSVVWGKELDSVYLEETDTSGILDKDNFFWSANKKYELITPHIGGGTGDNVYMTNVNSDISGYKKTSYTNDTGITSFSATASADTVLVQQFLFDGQLSTSILDAGGWIVRTYCNVSSIAGVSKFKYEFFVYDDADSTIFSFYSDEINNTAFQYNEYTSFQSAFNLGKSTYRLGVRVYFLTTLAANITGTFRVGDGETSYINTPIALRHERLRDKNGEENYLHINRNDQNAIDRYKIDSSKYVTYTNNSSDLDMGANSISTDTVKINGVPLLLNAFKKDSLGGAGNIFYSTGASSQPASGTVNQVVGNNYIQNQNSSFQNANLRISGMATIGSGVGINLSSESYYGSGILLKNISTENIEIRNWALKTDNLTYGDFAIKQSSYREGIPDVNILLFNETGGATFSSIVNATQFQSNIATGTPPLVVASSTKVDSLNVGLFDGKQASDFQLNSDTLTFDATLSDLADSSAAIRALANTKAVVSGTDNYIMKKTGANTLGNSNLRQNSTTGGIGIGIEPNRTLHLALNGQPTLALSDTRGGADQQEMGFLYDAGFALTRPGMVYQKLGNDGSFRQNLFTLFQNGTINFDGIAYPDSNTVVFGAKKIGAGTNSPAAQIHSQSTTTQARLGYDANKYTDLSTGSTGNFTIDPTGDTVKVVGAVNSTGGFFKNGVEITGVGGGGISNIGITVPTGLTVSPASLTANGTFTFGLQSGYSIPTTANQNNWNSGYDNQIISMTITGTTTKQIQLNQIDGGHVYGSFTDLSEAAWVDDTYGINYSAGRVGIGIGSDLENLLTIGNGSTNTKIAIKASSLNQRAIYATSSSNTAIFGQGGLDGVGGVGTRYGVQGSSPSGNGVRGASTNAAGVSGTSTYSYGGEFSGLGVNISSGGLLINGTTRISSTGTFTPSNGASGSFTSADGKTITVTNGIITGIN